ncbi:MAG TPA: hypothetical protein VMK12_30280 [Anaeromyxobacteraceae bacterium]|nr:hypothetical protein [Anaeromyxobacteraceae bacterium]
MADPVLDGVGEHLGQELPVAVDASRQDRGYERLPLVPPTDIGRCW